MMIPFILCFEYDMVGDLLVTSGTYIQLLIDIIFMVDIAINFSTGIYYEGNIVLSRTAIAKIYIRSW